MTGLEADFSLRSRLILIDVADYVLDGIQASAGLQCGLVRLLRTIARVNGVLIGLRRLCVGLTNAFLGARVHVLDLASILGGQIVEFIHPIADRAQLASARTSCAQKDSSCPRSLPAFPAAKADELTYSDRSSRPEWCWQAESC